MIAAPSPNFDARVAPPDIIVLHYTGMRTGPEALARLCDPAAKVSAHYLVEEDGRVFSLVPEARRAWHAGRAVWRGVADVNGRSVGIEIVNPGHEFGYRAFTEAQIAATIALIDDIRSRWTVPDGHLVGHSDVAPDRKTDPGELFPWNSLAQAGHGLWAEPQPAPGAALGPGDDGMGVQSLRNGLIRLGYGLASAGPYDDAMTQVVRAFQRHWRPTRFDGIADGETRSRLIALLRLDGA